MNNIRILEASYNVNDGIYFTDICQELVSKSLTFAGTFYQTCDIYELDDCRCHFLGIVHISK